MKQSGIVILGGGPGGYVAAIRASQLGAKVTLVEKDTLGGTCLNRGCIPTKALLHSVEILESVRSGKSYGIDVGNINIDFVTIMSRKNNVVKTLTNGVQYLMKSNSIEVIKGTGKLVSPTEIEIDSGQQESVKAGKVILTPGSIPSVVPISGVGGSGVITSDEALQLSEIPQSLLIIGGGVIGVEFATVFAKLGTEVTVVEMLPQIIPIEDQELAIALRRVLERDGIKIFTSTQVKEIEDGPEGNKVLLVKAEEGELKLEAKLVMVAVGRRPNTAGLGLEEIGIKLEQGAIIVNDRMETNIPGIYAAGDAIGGIQLAHVASAEGEVAAENALGKEAKIDYRAVPRCIYTMPEVAAVGLTEAQAKHEGRDIKIGKFPFTANPRALIMGQPGGFLKVVSDALSEEIIGFHIFGPHATELIAEAVLAMKVGATVADVSATIHAHPTLTEAMRETVLDTQEIAIHMPRKA